MMDRQLKAGMFSGYILSSPSALIKRSLDVHIETESLHLSLNSHGRFGDGISISTFTEVRNSNYAELLMER